MKKVMYLEMWENQYFFYFYEQEVFTNTMFQF